VVAQDGETTQGGGEMPEGVGHDLGLLGEAVHHVAGEEEQFGAFGLDEDAPAFHLFGFDQGTGMEVADLGDAQAIQAGGKSSKARSRWTTSGSEWASRRPATTP